MVEVGILMPVIEQGLLNRLLADFRLSHDGPHGARHWFAVLANGYRLAREVPGVDLVVVTWFALLHDCKREHDLDDPLHGERASAYAGDLADAGDLRIALDRVQLLRAAIRGHVGRSVTSHPTLGVCWDADRLELPRVGIDVDPFRMSTAPGRRIARSMP